MKEKELKFMSLYDYRGISDKDKIGKLVYNVAKTMHIPVGHKIVNHNKHNNDGRIMTYPKEFLDMFFKINLFFKSHYQN